MPSNMAQRVLHCIPAQIRLQQLNIAVANRFQQVIRVRIPAKDLLDLNLHVLELRVRFQITNESALTLSGELEVHLRSLPNCI